MGFFRQEYWSGLASPTPEDLPDPGIEPVSPALWANALTPEPPEKLKVLQARLQQRQWHPTPVLLPGESQGRGSLVGCSLWGRTESDTTEVT